MHPLAVGGDHLGEAGLVDRDLPRLQARDLVRIDVDAVHLAAQVGETRGGDEADVAGADDTDGLAHRQSSGRAGYWPMRCSERAMSIIWAFVSDFDRLLDTQ